eukprot:CAMPEP_0119028658 /NCGR_PEP_ID=MMETSP1176-20130426/39288_1 /TAXON_ID=265551 /ORGANISM="Synedropsis recta cf, Strain CCMP1620" /LENGTH=159 /DNA_ID=CAMNT_0006984849 /DNA_START=143 /DNA_END=619 /DNA_ORIENTATION=-
MPSPELSSSSSPSDTGAPDGGPPEGGVGLEVEGMEGGSEVAHPQPSRIRSGRSGHCSGVIVPSYPASCKRPHGTIGCPGKTKIPSGSVTHFPSPQMEHPPGGTLGQALGGGSSGTGTSVSGAAVGSGTGASVSGGSTGPPGTSEAQLHSIPTMPGKNGH